MNRPSVVSSGQAVFSLPVWLAIVLLAAIVAGYLMYDLGLARAGFRSTAAAEQIDALEAGNDALRATNKSLSERLAVLETATKVDREAYRQVESELADLQGRILQQQEDIEFYRGIVGEDDGSNLRIQSFQVVAGRREHEYELRLVLAQALRAGRDIAGKIELQLEGNQSGEPISLGLPVLTGEETSLRYNFRYFQDLKVTIALPPGFEPQRARVLVRPRDKGAETVEEFFVWQPENG
jgi:hypothetical protein